MGAALAGEGKEKEEEEEGEGRREMRRRGGGGRVSSPLGCALPLTWWPDQALAHAWLQFCHLAGEVGLGDAQASFPLSAPETLQVPPCGRIPQGTLSRRVLLSPFHCGHGTEPRAAVARKPGLCWKAHARPWELGRAARSSVLSSGDPAAASPSRVTLKRCGRGQPCHPPSWVSPLGQSPIWPWSLQHPPRTYVYIPAPRTRQLGLHRCKQGRDLEMRSAWIWAVPCAPGQHMLARHTGETQTQGRSREDKGRGGGAWP